MVSPTRTLQIVGFLDMVAAGLIMPQLPPHAAMKLGFNHIQVGLVMSLFSICQMVAGPLIGSLSDVKGRKRVLMWCLGICIFAYAYLGITTSFYVFFGLRAILGLFKQTQFILTAITPDYEKDTKKHAVLYGQLLSLTGLGMTTGPVFSGHIVDAYPDNGFTIVTMIAAALFAFNTVLVYLLPDPKKVEKSKPKDVVLTSTLFGSLSDSLKQSVAEFYNVDWKIYWDTFLFKLILTISVGLYFSGFALYLNVKHRVSSTNLGYIMAFQGAIGAFSSYFIGYVNKFYENDKSYSRRISHLFITLTFSLLAIAWAPSVLMIVAILLPKSLSDAVGRTITLEMITSKSKESHRGTVMGAANTVRSLSGIVTPVFAGFVMQYFGIVYVFYLAAMITTIGFVLSYRMDEKIVKTKTK